jgi:hypothetical protein
MFKWMRRAWCKRVHGRPMWPMHGKYMCSRCLQEYPVFWETGKRVMSHAAGVRPQPGYPEAVPVAVPANGSADPSTYFTRARRADSRTGFSKKCTSVAGMP